MARGRKTRVSETYLDTRDRRLLAAGFACRRRRQAAQWLITLTRLRPVEGDIESPEELEIALPENVPPAQWGVGPARERILGLAGAEPLRPLFRWRRTRCARDVLDGGAVIAEWRVDEVRVSAGGESLQFAELEIAVKGATGGDLARLTRDVQVEFGLASESRSRFERALSWADATAAERKRRIAAKKARRRSAPRIALDDTMAEAARKTLLLHWERMLEHEQGARAGGDIERVHDMRVATPRMRAALRVFRAYLDAEAFKPHARILRRAARALGAVRDLDVFREKTLHYADSLPAERQSELDALLAAWHVEHQRARQELLALIDGAAFMQFKADFDAFLRTPGAVALPSGQGHTDPVAHRVRDDLPVVLLRAYADVRAHADSVSAPDVPLTQLHQLRIACKRLRYTLEAFADVLDRESRTSIAQVKHLQEHLGNLQDAAVACTILSDFLTRGEWSGPGRKPSRRRTLVLAPGVATYLAARQNEIHDLVRTFPEVWSPILHADFKRRLLALIAAW